MTVLIVDDQPDVVRGEEQGVDWKALGIDIILSAYSVPEAEKILLSQPVDVMLCDIEMPPRSGLELLSLIREKKLSTRCIFLTAHAEFSYAQEAVKLGGFDYILQPAPYSEIEAAVRRAMADIKEKEPHEREKTQEKHTMEYKGSSSPVASAIEYIRQNLDRDISRGDIAEAIYLNPEYLSRLFKKETGISLNEFIVREKMEQAKSMLEETTIPVSLIALKIGYTNFSYFSQLFKKHTGLTPLEYRQQRGRR
jgi:two-component system, response regulator YesN